MGNENTELMDRPEIPALSTEEQHFHVERGLPVVSQQVLKELRHAQRRELQSFLDGKACLTGGAGWWRHEVCYGGRITQYHEVKAALGHLANLSSSF